MVRGVAPPGLLSPFSAGYPHARSYRDLSANFDDAIGRDTEVSCRILSATGQPDEKHILPARHFGLGGEPERASR